MVHQHLRGIKAGCHPFGEVLRALGFNESQFLEPYPSGSVKSPKATSEPLMSYPFPTTATALDWPCFDELDDIEIEELDYMLDDMFEEIWDGIEEWREEGEQQLVIWWGSGAGLIDGDSETDEDSEIDEETILKVFFLVSIIRLH
jgi:hypothetical protein